MSKIQPLNLAKQESAGDWFRKNLHLSQSAPIALIDDLTQERAELLLSLNPENRKISRTIVEKYARDIANGAWTLNGQTVVVSVDGFLNDGQHRSLAVIEAQRSVPVVFVFGVARETRMTVDQGKTRMAGDYLGMQGHADAVALAAVASNLWQYECIGRLSPQAYLRPTKVEIQEVVAKRPQVVESLNAISKRGANNLGGRALLAFCHCVFAQKNRAAADEFMLSLCEGLNLSAGSPILYARNRLSDRRGRMMAGERAELVFRAWNAWRRGDKNTRSLPVLGEGLPEVER